ncbi:MAG: hypothetical protein R3F19_11695 [Verrucomicrobiales bacterium]
MPNTRVEPYYDSYRLYFADEAIDFAQAVALVYYYFPLAFGCLRAWGGIKEEERKLVVFLDRFPAVSRGEIKPGEIAQKTQGMKFLEFIREHSATAKGIDDENQSEGAICTYTNLEWWRREAKDDLKEGKKYPHFVLADWLVSRP